MGSIVTEVALIGALLFWITIFLKGWRLGIRLLLAYMPFAGAVVLLFFPSSLPTLFKDLFFVIPIYLTFGLHWILRKGTRGLPRFPSPILVLLLVFSIMVLVQAVNPSVYSLMVAAIGIKVWLFYLPMIGIGFLYARQANDFVGLLRIMVVLAWVPCLVGIGEYVASSIWGYADVMNAIYGDAALSATQNLQIFDYGGAILRIPSTFSYWLQYSGFALFMIVPAYMLMRYEHTSWWHSFSRTSIGLFVIAALLSGAKANFILVPSLLFMIFILEGSFRKFLVIGLVILVLASLVMVASGISTDLFLSEMNRLFLKYMTEYVVGGLRLAIEEALWGMGTGMNTGPARYAFEDPSVFSPIENYYAKTIYELGLLGIFILLWVYLGIVLRGLLQHAKIIDHRLRSFSSAILAFLIVILLNSIKGWQLDIDPLNVYFWFFSGVLLRLKYDFMSSGQTVVLPHQSPNARHHIPVPANRSLLAACRREAF